MHKKKVVLAVAALSFIIIGLGFAAYTQQAGTPGDMSGAGPGKTAADTYVGLTEEEAVARAEKADVTYRIVLRDGDESFPITMDYSPDRINFEVNGGRVTKAYGG